MQPERVDQLLEHGYLWNTNGIAEYFFSLFGRPEFLGEYRSELTLYKGYIDRFTTATAEFEFVRAFKTSANFQLMQMPEGVSAETIMALLLLRHGIYVRSCGDKIGLDGEFLRVAIRTESENVRVLTALTEVLG
jgi:histidinol-phosphate/aromatic aminotransferase/cobyric acid decarboxylase-like protein